VRTARFARRGRGLADKAAIFLIIAFETTSFANPRRRARVKRLLGAIARDGLLIVRFRRDGEDFVFQLRAGDDGDLSVASEFIRGGYLFPGTQPAQIVDGGANIGLFAVLASKRFPDVRISCFEANPDNIATLSRNLEINAANAEVFNTALWSRDSELVFHNHLAYSGHVAEAEAATEPGATRIPAVLPRVDADCWMKLDIEGAEYEVLPALLAAGRYPRWISAELHHFIDKGPALIEMLKRHGYQTRTLPEQPTSDLVDLFAERAAA